MNFLKILKKKLLLFALIFALGFSLSACGTEEKSGNPNMEEKTEFKDAAEHILYSGFKTYNIKNFGADVSLRVDADLEELLKNTNVLGGKEAYSKFANEFLKDFAMKYHLYFKYDEKKQLPKFSFEYALKYKDKVLADIDLTSGEKKLGISTPSLSKKGFAIDYKTLTKNNSEKELKNLNALLSINYVKYIDIFLGDKTAYRFFNEDLANYSAIYSEFLNETFKKTGTTSIERDGKKISVTEYEGNYNLEKNFDFQEKILLTLKDDQKLQKLVAERLVLVLDEFLNSKDYELFGLSELEVKNIRDQVAKFDANDAEFKKKWDESFDRAMTELKMNRGIYEHTNRDLFGKIESKVLIRIDEKNMIDSSVMELGMDNLSGMGKVSLHAEIVNKEPKDTDFKDVEKFKDISAFSDTANTTNFDFLMENKDTFEYAKEYAIECIDYFLEGEALKPVYELMEKHGLNMEKSILEITLKQYKTQIENIKF